MFSNPELLRQTRRDLLLAWLLPAQDYLMGRGWAWPEAVVGRAEAGSVDYERLTEILLDPRTDAPGYLGDSLFLIHGMANPAGMDLILENAEGNGFGLDPGEDSTPADVAFQAWLLNPGLLEDLHNCRELTRPRSFQYFANGSDTPPAFAEPTPPQLAIFERRLEAFYVASRRGPGVRVFPYRQLDEWWFLVRHGAACRREPALESGQPTAVFFRPQKHDVLRYGPARGELGVNCCTERERRVLLRLFGSCFFGRPDTFPDTAKYSLEPLVRRGRHCLACIDVPGLERVRLTEVEFFFRGQPWKRTTERAADIFALIEGEDLKWPDRIEDITRATFEVKFCGKRRPRALTIVPCNKALYACDADSNLLERWMLSRGFISEKTLVSN